MSVRSAVDYAKAAIRIRAQRARWKLERPRVIRAYLKRNTAPKLHLGAGNHLIPGYLNCDLEPSSDDVLYIDATEPLPFKDATFDVVFSEHMIEHLPYDGAQLLCREVARVLKPGGVFRVATPSLETLIGLVTAGDDLASDQQAFVDFVVDTFAPGAPRNGCFVLNHNLRTWGHQFVYDRATLSASLADAGFAKVAEMPVGTSDHPALAGLELHGVTIDSVDMNTFETMVFEATK